MTLIDAPHGDRTIWMYWECAPGHGMPALIRRCIDLARRRDARVTLLDRSSVTRYISPLPAADKLHAIAQRADYFRAKLLHRHGGMWLDADTLVRIALGPYLRMIFLVLAWLTPPASEVMNSLDAIFDQLHDTSGSLLAGCTRLRRKAWLPHF